MKKLLLAATAIAAAIPIDFGVVCLWATVGLVLAALMFTLGFDAEVAQALAMAG
jgi:hypothetical protein